MRHFSALGDVVGVAINYRLNVFGFLAADKSDHPGNLGLHDMILALKWVNNSSHLIYINKIILTILIDIFKGTTKHS